MAISGKGRPPIDDVILGYDGVAIADAQQLSALLRRAEPGTPVKLEVFRGGAFRTLQVAPDAPPKSACRRGSAKPSAESSKIRLKKTARIRRHSTTRVWDTTVDQASCGRSCVNRAATTSR